MASPISAAGAYAAMQKVGGGIVPTQVSKPQMPGADGGGGFAGLLQQFAGGAADSARKAEGSMVQATAGKADLVEVVTAISESEAALETLVAVRDKMIAAYEEIMRMPI
jgi:flagellar hook-basal body complex protein FliE